MFTSPSRDGPIRLSTVGPGVYIALDTGEAGADSRSPEGVRLPAAPSTGVIGITIMGGAKNAIDHGGIISNFIRCRNRMASLPGETTSGF